MRSVLTDYGDVVDLVKGNIESNFSSRSESKHDISAHNYDWSENALQQNTRELLTDLLGVGEGGTTCDRKLLVLCADCVHKPLYGEENPDMLLSALKSVFEEAVLLMTKGNPNRPTGNDVGANGANGDDELPPSTKRRKSSSNSMSQLTLTIEALISLEHRSNDDGTTEFQEALEKVGKETGLWKFRDLSPGSVDTDSSSASSTRRSVGDTECDMDVSVARDVIVGEYASVSLFQLVKQVTIPCG